MDKHKILQENAKYFDALSDKIFYSLNNLSEGVTEFDDIEQYNLFQLLVKEGFLSKNYRKYTLTEKGQGLLESYVLFKKDPNKFKLMSEEVDTDKQISIKYKRHEEETNTILTEEARFDIEADGLPLVIVSEEVYSNLIHRTKGTHWKQYLGESGRQLVRQKKLSKFYVQEENTGRKYLYILP